MPQPDQRLLRSAEPAFNYKEHCLFCGKPDTYNHRRAVKGHKLKQVKTKEFQSEIERLCDTRMDRWSHTVKSRLNSINDLFAADAVYHQVCSGNIYWTHPQIALHITSLT